MAIAKETVKQSRLRLCTQPAGHRALSLALRAAVGAPRVEGRALTSGEPHGYSSLPLAVLFKERVSFRFSLQQAVLSKETS